MTLHQLTYISLATRDFSPSEMDELLLQAREKNARLGITGLLIYHQKEFIQVLEGGKTAIFSVYKTICADPRNRSNYLMWDEPINQRSFPDWTMGYLAADGLSNQDQPNFAPFFEPGYSGLTRDATESTGKRFLSIYREIFLRQQPKN